MTQVSVRNKASRGKYLNPSSPSFAACEAARWSNNPEASRLLPVSSHAVRPPPGHRKAVKDEDDAFRQRRMASHPRADGLLPLMHAVNLVPGNHPCPRTEQHEMPVTLLPEHGHLTEVIERASDAGCLGRHAPPRSLGGPVLAAPDQHPSSTENTSASPLSLASPLAYSRSKVARYPLRTSPPRRILTLGVRQPALPPPLWRRKGRCRA